jgi:hypothetical protein
MLNSKAAASDIIGAEMAVNNSATAKVRGGGVFAVQCFDKDGNLTWEAEKHNLVVNVGLKDMNDKYFSGSAYTATWYLGLITGPSSGTTFAAGDTLASHAGWTEFTNYSGNRGAITFGAATTADPSVITNPSVVAFTITGAGGTVAGAFLASVATGTAGILFSESDFQSPGDRVVGAGDVLNATYQFSLDAA